MKKILLLSLVFAIAFFGLAILYVFVYEEAGNFAAAINAYKEILKSEPYHAMVLYSIASDYGSL